MNLEQRVAFNKFWEEHWPKCRRKDKKKTEDQWARIAPELYAVIYAAVDRQKKQPSWNPAGDCKFIPYPHRWLRDRRWEDEISLPEDQDADILIEAICKNDTMPGELPKHIAARFRAMCARIGSNWPRLHVQFMRDQPPVEQFVRKEFLATENKQ